jgi:putative Ig domain-containing protein
MSTGKLGASLLLILAMAVGATVLARAETVDCTPIATLPAVLTVQGLYCLTANLSTASTTGNAIDVQAPNVVLDLNGFTLDGSGAGAGTQAVGIHALNQVNITIKNGTIRGFLRGIFLEDAGGSQGHVVDNVRADRNTYVGLQVEGKGIVVRQSQSAGTGGTTTFGADANAIGILAAGVGPRVVENDVTDTTKQGTGTAVGIQFKATTVGGLAEDNRITTADKGVEFLVGGTGKCRNNLIFSVTTPFVGCTDASNNAAPAITSPSSVTFAPGLAGQTFLVTTTGSPTNTISRTGTLPSGVTFTDNLNNTATIAGTPAAGTQTSSPYAWVITAANGNLPNATQNFTFNVVCPTINVSGTIPDLFLNQPMATAPFTQTGGNGTITWSATGLPTGVSINTSTGEVTGTPTQSGSFNATITATDAGGCTGAKLVAFLVKDPPKISSADNVTVAPGIAMTPFSVTTTGSPTNTISRTGTLPSGVTFTDNLNNTATIAGTPAAGTQTGSPYAWVITASNGVGSDATQNFTFNVVCPVINVSGTIPALTFNTLMSPVTFTQTGGNGTITWSQTNLPTGVTINTSSGQVSGTPSVTGTFNVTITATDVGGCTGSKNQSVTVAPVATGDAYSGLVDNTQFVITGGTTTSPLTPFVGQAFAGRLTANDLPNGGVTATAETKATTANGSVTIAADGTFIYTPKANPTAGRTTSDSFTYTVTSNTGGGTAVTSAPGTVNLTLVGRVWYVLNNGAAGNGQSQSPFLTLSAAIAASTAGASATDTDTIYVYQGDGTITNLATASILKSLQSFIGQGVALVVNGNTLVGAGGFPLIGNTLTLANTVTVNGIDMSTAANSALVGVSTTSLSVTVRNLTTTTGTALNLSGATHPTGTVTVTTVTTNGSGGGAVHVSLTNVDAAVALNGGSLAGAGANIKAIDINGGTGPFTYAGTISNTGSTGTNGGGISVANKTGTSTVTLSGSTKTLNTGANTAVNISGNSAGTTVAFSGGGLGITTTLGTGFNATASGTVNVSGSNNTITSTTGTAVNLNGVGGTVGLRSVTANVAQAAGAANGIAIQSTVAGFSFTVDGDGSNTAVGGNSTGGTISRMEGADGAVAGNGVYLSSTGGITLRRMTINGVNQNNGVRGISVTNFHLEYSTVSGTNGNNTGFDEGAVVFDNLLGAATITNCLIEGGFEDNLNVVNTTGTLDRLVITGSTFGFNSTANGNNNILMEVFNPGTLKWTLQSSTIKGARADWINAQSSGGSGIMDTILGGVGLGNTFDNLGSNVHPSPVANGNRILLNANGTHTFNVSNNTIKGSLGNALAITGLTGTASMTGRIQSNDIGVAGTANSGSTGAGGISVQSGAGSDITVLVDGNDVRQYNNHGIIFTLGDEMGSVSTIINATVSNNTTNTPGTLLTDFNGFHVNNGSVSTDDFTSCFNISDNNFTGGGKGATSPNNNDLRLRQRQGTTIQLPGYTGPARDNGDNAVAEVVTYLGPVGSGGLKNNVFGSATANSVSTGGGYVNSPGGAACTLPP